MRSSNSENSTREIIVTTALKLFLTYGYEGTSVRMILKEANVVTGSFYHFFKSKEELFEEVINRFMDMHVAQISDVSTDDTQPIQKQLELILEIVEQNTKLYFDKLQAGQLHWTVQLALHERMLQAILPSIKSMIEKALASRMARNVMGLDIHTLSVVVLQGVKGILRAVPIEEMDDTRIVQIRKNVLSYVAYVLGVEFAGIDK